MKKNQKKNKQQKTPSEKGVLTKNDFFKALDKVIGVVKPKQKSRGKGKSKTSE